MRKGFVFTLDALLASALMIIFVLYILSALNSINRSALSRTQLSRDAYDILVSADKNGTLQQIAESGGNRAYFSEYELAYGRNHCATFLIYRQSNNLVTAFTFGCRLRLYRFEPVRLACGLGDDTAVVDRSFLLYNRTSGIVEYYVAELRSCYKT